jgi:hypothetical protein
VGQQVKGSVSGPSNLQVRRSDQGNDASCGIKEVKPNQNGFSRTACQATAFWFNLIGFNRACWKTFGPEGAYKSFEPDIRVNMSMVITSEKILKKKIRLNDYDNLFQVESSPEDKEMMANINAFMSLILPDINAGRVPDIEKNAAKAGIDIETARNFYKAVSDKFGQMDRKKG